MTKTVHGKLVRDKIPATIEKRGEKAMTRKASAGEYPRLLAAKLDEEVKEFLVSGDEEELADILEVLNAICESRGHGMEKIEALRKKKAAERGGFSARVVLEETRP